MHILREGQVHVSYKHELNNNVHILKFQEKNERLYLQNVI